MPNVRGEVGPTASHAGRVPELAISSVGVLPYPPQHAGRIEQAEVPHPPGLRLDAGHLHAVFRCDAAGGYVIPPSIYILDEDMHHEVLSQGLGAGVLKQEAHVIKVEVGNAASI